MLDPSICQHVCVVFVDQVGFFKIQKFMEQRSRNAMPGSRIARFGQWAVLDPLCLMNGWNGWPILGAKLSQDHDMTINLRKTVDFLQSRDDR